MAKNRVGRKLAFDDFIRFAGSANRVTLRKWKSAAIVNEAELGTISRRTDETSGFIGIQDDGYSCPAADSVVDVDGAGCSDRTVLWREVIRDVEAEGRRVVVEDVMALFGIAVRWELDDVKAFLIAWNTADAIERGVEKGFAIADQDFIVLDLRS